MCVFVSTAAPVVCHLVHTCGIFIFAISRDHAHYRVLRQLQANVATVRKQPGPVLGHQHVLNQSAQLLPAEGHILIAADGESP